ncbi:MAG: hypothetical protein ABW046_17145 [Actinoplanes sp.]
MDDVNGDFRAAVNAALATAADRLIEHPYYHALRRGTLPEVAHGHFAGQDLHLLPAYGRAHARAASGAPGADTARFLARMAAICLDNADTDATGAARPAAGPTTVAYTSFLAAAAGSSPAAALGALLPSAHLQLVVNDDLRTRVEPGSRYAQRVHDDHPGEEYRKLIDQFVDLVVAFGAARCAVERADLLDHLVLAGRFEHRFVEAAWLLEDWPK